MSVIANKEMLTKLEELVRQTAEDHIVSCFESQDFSQQTKIDGSVITEVDHKVQDQLENNLKNLWPEIAFLGEEMPSEQQQELLNSSAIWCLDPLDGTSNFASGIPFFAVSLALIENGQTTLGLIYDPIRKESFSAIKEQGCWLNGSIISSGGNNEASELKQMIAVVDLKRLLKPPYKKLLSAICGNHPYRSQRNFGSCAVEWCWLAASRFQVYIHGGQKLWDYAAGILILREAGGQVSTIEGDDISPKNLVPQPVVAGCNQSSYQTWYEWIKTNK